MLCVSAAQAEVHRSQRQPAQSWRGSNRRRPQRQQSPAHRSQMVETQTQTRHTESPGDTDADAASRALGPALGLAQVERPQRLPLRPERSGPLATSASATK